MGAQRGTTPSDRRTRGGWGGSAGHPDFVDVPRDGRPGGGDAGGPSIGALMGGGSALNWSGSSFAAAAGGAGGPSPGGNAGPAGLSRDTLTP